MAAAPVNPAPPAALLQALLLDGQGGARPLDWEAVQAWRPEAGVLWVHLLADAPATRPWLERATGLPEATLDSLLADETRPRALPLPSGLLLILRGANLNPGQPPEDLVTMRVWAEPRRVITLRRRPLHSVAAIEEALLAGTGPRSAGGLVEVLVEGLVDRLAPLVADLDDELDEIEEEIVEGEARRPASGLADARRRVIALRRYLAPQREAFHRLAHEPPPWFEAEVLARLLQLDDQVTRLLEDLDHQRERAAVAQDELDSRLSHLMNRRIFLFTLMATVILPLSLLTGLLGVNVGGIPGASDPRAFLLVCAGLVAVGLIEWTVLRLLRWI